MFNAKVHKKSQPFDLFRFHRNLELAISLIETNTSLEAQVVMQAIREKKVNLSTFFFLTKEHYFELKEDVKKTYNVKLPNRFPPGDLAVRQIESTLRGIIFDGYSIYLNSTLNPTILAETIIHEVYHHLNQSLCLTEERTLSEKASGYRDEIRSFKAELQFQNPQAMITRKKVAGIHFFVQKHYPELIEDDHRVQNGHVNDLLDTSGPSFKPGQPLIPTSYII
tara:strand:- start:82 stop:750 length:669 start_codon:yes stop_codon:yes gene_type:complete